MIKLGPVEIAKYPFVEDAGSYIRDIGFTLDMLGTDPDMRVFIDTAMKRIRTAADGGVYEILPEMHLTNGCIIIETLSFLVAVILKVFLQSVFFLECTNLFPCATIGLLHDV